MSQTTMQLPQFEPTQTITVVLQAQEWNLVFAGLGELPYRISQPVIDRLRTQFMAPAPAKTNGIGSSDDDDVQVYRRARDV